MLKESRAGAAALLAAPPLVIASAIITPTLSDEPGRRYAALSAHRGAVIAGSTLGLVALVLLIAGTVWLALALASQAPRLAVAGGALGVLGSLVVMFENSVTAAMPAVVRGLDPAQATAALHRVSTAGAISGLEPLSILQALGLALLGLAVVKAGAPRWAGVAIALGAIAELVGFATGTKSPVIAGFAVLFAGLVIAASALLGRPAGRLADGTQEAAGVLGSERLQPQKASQAAARP